MSNLVSTANTSEIIQDLVLKGDLAKMDDSKKLSYYNNLCQSLQLNPLTRPFEILKLQDKEVMYATKSCTEQLRKIYNLSCKIVKSEVLDSVYIVTVEVTDGKRTDTSTGAVSLVKENGTWEMSKDGKRYFKKDGTYIPLFGDEKANALMKAETKAKRRATLSICGLGILDESEIETIPNAQKMVRIENNLDELEAALEEVRNCSNTQEVAEIAKKYPQFHTNSKFIDWCKKQQEMLKQPKNE